MIPNLLHLPNSRHIVLVHGRAISSPCQRRNGGAGRIARNTFYSRSGPHESGMPGNTGRNSLGITSHSLPLAWRTPRGKEFAEAGTGFSYFLPLSRIHPRSIACILDAHTLYPRWRGRHRPRRSRDRDEASWTLVHTRVARPCTRVCVRKGTHTCGWENVEEQTEYANTERTRGKLQSSPSIARVSKERETEREGSRRRKWARRTTENQLGRGGDGREE